MSFLEKIGLDIIANERDMLRAIRDAAENWFNQLTEPFLDTLRSQRGDEMPRLENRKVLAEAAQQMFRAEVLVNQGNALGNRLAEIDKSLGLPFFSGRTELRIAIADFLEAGDFLKKFSEGHFPRTSNVSDYWSSVQAATRRWEAFRSAKDALVKQVNGQIAAIG